MFWFYSVRCLAAIKLLQRWWAPTVRQRQRIRYSTGTVQLWQKWKCSPRLLAVCPSSLLQLLCPWPFLGPPSLSRLLCLWPFLIPSSSLSPLPSPPPAPTLIRLPQLPVQSGPGGTRSCYSLLCQLYWRLFGPLHLLVFGGNCWNPLKLLYKRPAWPPGALAGSVSTGGCLQPPALGGSGAPAPNICQY